MMKNRSTYNREHPITKISVILLIGLFAIFSLLIVIFSINMYRNIVSVTDQNSDARAAVFYLSNKIRSADETGMIDVDNSTQVTYLVIGHGDQTAGYQTMIYYYNGALREILVPADSYPSLEDGDAIVALDDFTIEKNDNVIYYTVVCKDGRSYQMHISLQSEQ